MRRASTVLSLKVKKKSDIPVLEYSPDFFSCDFWTAGNQVISCDTPLALWEWKARAFLSCGFLLGMLVTQEGSSAPQSCSGCWSWPGWFMGVQYTAGYLVFVSWLCGWLILAISINLHPSLSWIVSDELREVCICCLKMICESLSFEAPTLTRGHFRLFKCCRCYREPKVRRLENNIKPFFLSLGISTCIQLPYLVWAIF